MSFRISVEAMICRHQGTFKEVLLVKRAPHCRVAPGVWNVPAGKVKQLEITTDAVVREAYEETKLRVEVIKLLAENAFEIKEGNQTAYRNMFTYLMKLEDESQQVELDEEHTDFEWVTEENLDSEQYSTLMPRLKEIILKGFKENAN